MRRQSSGGQSGSSGAGDALPAPSGAAASMDRQGFRARGHLDTLDPMLQQLKMQKLLSTGVHFVLVSILGGI